MCYGTTVLCFETQGCVRNAWLGQRKQDFFFTVGYVYFSLATVKSQIWEMAVLNAFCSTKGESQPVPRLFLLPFLCFLPTCMLHQCWWLAGILHPVHLTEQTDFLFLFPPCPVFGQTSFLLVSQTESAHWEVKWALTSGEEGAGMSPWAAVGC